MSRMIKQLRTLTRVRRRLRDVAAGAFALADLETRATTLQVESIGEARRALIDGAPARILGGSDANELLLIEMERGAADRLVASAIERRVASEKVSEARRAALVRGEAGLRTAERLFERAIDVFDEAVRRDEQRTTDDLVAARSRRSWRQ